MNTPAPAQFLTYVASTGNAPDQTSENNIELRYEDENIWLTQKLMAELYGVSVPTINHHIRTLISDRETSPATN